MYMYLKNSNSVISVVISRQKKSLGKSWRRKKRQVCTACSEMSSGTTRAMTRPGSCPGTAAPVPSAPKASSTCGTRSLKNAWSALNARWRLIPCRWVNSRNPWTRGTAVFLWFWFSPHEHPFSVPMTDWRARLWEQRKSLVSQTLVACHRKWTGGFFLNSFSVAFHLSTFLFHFVTSVNCP